MKKTFKLHHPLVFDVEGEQRKVEEMELDFERLTVRDMIEIDRQYLLSDPLNESLSLREVTKEYQLLVAERITELPLQELYQLKPFDFSRMTVMIHHFLVLGYLPKEETKKDQSDG